MIPVLLLSELSVGGGVSERRKRNRRKSGRRRWRRRRFHFNLPCIVMEDFISVMASRSFRIFGIFATTH